MKINRNIVTTNNLTGFRVVLLKVVLICMCLTAHTLIKILQYNDPLKRVIRILENWHISTGILMRIDCFHYLHSDKYLLNLIKSNQIGIVAHIFVVLYGTILLRRISICLSFVIVAIQSRQDGSHSNSSIENREIGPVTTKDMQTLPPSPLQKWPSWHKRCVMC